MKTLTHLQTRIFDTPLAIQPKKLEIILAAIGDRLGLHVSAEDLLAAQNYTPATPRNFDVAGSVAIIPVQGTLMKTTSGLMAASGCTSYEDIAAGFQLAMESPEITSILLDIDSPGGEVHGMFELSDLIYSSRGKKPIVAVANDSAYSAAYAIASAADSIYVTRTGGVGSVGVFCLHVDQSAADKAEGLKYTYVHAGSKKIDGNPHAPLSETALKDAQAEVDREYGLFCQLVSRNRGISMEKVMGTQAGTYFADSAVPLLADKIGTSGDAFLSLVGQQSYILNNTVSKTTNKTTGDRPMNETLVAKSDELEIETDKACDKAEAEGAMKIEAKNPEKDTGDEAPSKVPGKKDKGDEDEKDDNKAAFLRIINLCTLAGAPSMAATYIGAGMDVKQVEKALLEKRAMESTQTKVQPLTAPVGAFDKLNGYAKEVKKTKGNKSDAYAQMLTANADSYLTYLEERDEACRGGLNTQSTRTYLAGIDSKVRGN